MIINYLVIAVRRSTLLLPNLVAGCKNLREAIVAAQVAPEWRQMIRRQSGRSWILVPGRQNHQRHGMGLERLHQCCDLLGTSVFRRLESVEWSGINQVEGNIH